MSEGGAHHVGVVGFGAVVVGILDIGVGGLEQGQVGCGLAVGGTVIFIRLSVFL